MNRLIRTSLLCSAGVAGLLSLNACGRHQPADPAKAPTPVAARSAPVNGIVAAARSSVPGPVAAPPTVPAMTAPAASPAPASPPAATAPFAVAALTLGDAVDDGHHVTHPGNRFAAGDKAIYASVASTGSSGGVTLNAKWRYLEGAGQLVSSISQSIATDGPAVTTFKLENPDLWPEGKYMVEISLDGRPVTRQDFEIGKD